MKPIIAKKDFSLNNQPYFIGDEIKNLNYEQISKLNEKGFIQPLSLKELQEYKQGINKKYEFNNMKEGN